MRTLSLIGLLAAFAISPVLAQEDASELPGEGAFQKRCGQCHNADDPAGPASSHWLSSVDAPLTELTPEQQQEVLQFLQHHGADAAQKVSVSRERALFEEKCNLCHSADRIFLEPLDSETRRHIVLRMQKRAPDWITPEEMETILAYLDKGAPGAPRPGDEPPAENSAELFRERCSSCHTLERVYLYLEDADTTADAWMHIVNRMQQKAPDLITPEEAQQILSYLQKLEPVME